MVCTTHTHTVSVGMRATLWSKDAFCSTLQSLGKAIGVSKVAPLSC
jgi:hypothetical protein